jgi:ribosomal protein S18 acetylase RimI-like enzyme
MSTPEEKETEEKKNQLDASNIDGDDESIRIDSPIEDQNLPQVCQVLEDSFSTKRCFCVFDINVTLPELQSRYAKMMSAKRALGAIALDSRGRVLGYVQMAAGGMTTYQMNLHSCKSDEMYIEILGVSSSARGKGVGTRLLEWCRETAINYSSGIDRLTLEVLRGNRAIGLYERFGFTAKSVDCCDEACGAVFVCCLMGRPYGMCNEGWGAIEMEMILYRREPITAAVER